MLDLELIINQNHCNKLESTPNACHIRSSCKTRDLELQISFSALIDVFL